MLAGPAAATSRLDRAAAALRGSAGEGKELGTTVEGVVAGSGEFGNAMGAPCSWTERDAPLPWCLRANTSTLDAAVIKNTALIAVWGRRAHAPARASHDARGREPSAIA